MKTILNFILSVFLIVTSFIGCTPSAPTITTVQDSLIVKNDSIIVKQEKDEPRDISKVFFGGSYSFKVPAGSRIDTIITDTVNKRITVKFNESFGHIAFREENVTEIYSALKNLTGNKEGFSFSIYAGDYTIEELVPNYYRRKTERDNHRLPVNSKNNKRQVVKNLDKPFSITHGLNDKNIVLWHSHGWYYSVKSGRWEWQRPRLFQTVEDLLPLSFVLPYLAPMLENAGANVYIPRERDTQLNEVVVDNDTHNDSKNKSYIEKTSSSKIKIQNGNGSGFAFGTGEYEVNENPFLNGTYRILPASTKETATITWCPVIPESGEYAVYISYKGGAEYVSDAGYTVYHSGGKTRFSVNQTIGGSSWYYLGTFHFVKGQNPLTGSVQLSNQSAEPGKYVSADAVRFGGGMGVVKRNGETSGRPKFTEGARYWLQYAGMPDTLVYNLNKENDYNDDYQSRSEYGNYLNGAPSGPTKNKKAGLGIPIDLSLAFHTDAGITSNDTVVGTLSIFSTTGSDTQRIFPNGVSRLACRDFADILQTEIVNEIRAGFDPAWNRRQLRDAEYSEAFRPNFPSALLELLSHQNFLDMQMAADPRFRFLVSRAIYKGILKYIADANGYIPVVQPLPVSHFRITEMGKGYVRLSWKPVNDEREPGAQPTGFIVYTRKEHNGFDNGVYTEKPEIVINGLKDGVIYSFKVTAVNKGGESFPSEILSACRNAKNPEAVLIVNGFNRVAPPAVIKTKEFTGFLNMVDAGVPDKKDLNFTGVQTDFLVSSKYLSNDAPGHGASSAYDETRIFAGNTFDYPLIHGEALRKADISFISSSDEAFGDLENSPEKYRFIDFIYGEEKETHWVRKDMDSVNGICFRLFPQNIVGKIEKYLSNGGKLFISGSYLCSDIFLRSNTDSALIKFVQKKLRYTYGASYASQSGKIFPVHKDAEKFSGYSFNTILSENIYQVEAPDALNPIGGSETLFRYTDNNFSAVTGFMKEYGVVTAGFPFETLNTVQERENFMKEVLRFLKVK